MIKNILTVDLEDWYQSSIELFNNESKSDEIIKPTERVVVNTEKLLKVFKKYDVKATFFTLGTVAEKYPKLILKIKNNGHEIASHGYSHKLVYKQNKEEFREDLKKSIEIIENIINEKVLGYRAPYFSVKEESLWALDVLKEEGLEYDSSIFPLKRKLYGVNNIKAIKSRGIIELAASKADIFGYEFPVGGGGYLRLFPYAITRWAMKKLNNQKKPAVVYIHPYEVDVGDYEDYGFEKSIRTGFACFKQKFNRRKTVYKIESLLRDFEFIPVRDYINPG